MLDRHAWALRRRLTRWLDQFKDCFGHRAQHVSLRQYVDGLLGDSARKSMAAMLARVSEPTSYQAFQHFITHAPWDAEVVWRRLRAVVPEHTDLLILDETSFPIRVPVGELRAIRTEEEFRPWFERHLAVLTLAILRKNAGNERVQPGVKWGHATKVQTIFLREMVSHTRLFAQRDVDRLERLLYVPLDSITMKRLRDLGQRLPFRRIKDIDTAKKFYDVQDALGEAARKAGAPRVWFDDNWGDRDP